MFKKKRITFFIHTKTRMNLFRHNDIHVCRCKCIQSEFMFLNQQLASAYCVQIFPEVSSRYRGSWSKEDPKFQRKGIILQKNHIKITRRLKNVLSVKLLTHTRNHLLEQNI